MKMDSKALASNIKTKVLEMVHKAKASHIGGAFSMTDLLAVLYSGVLKIDPKNPADPLRDRFILSKGHACSALYAVLGYTGFFDVDLLDSYGENESIFLTHTNHKVPGVELSTGSLGHGLSVCCGIALAAKRKKENFHTYCLISDGELDEGSNWEAILFAPHHQLSNLTLLVDYNKIQSLGTVEEVLVLEPLAAKFEAFGWSVLEIDGHDHDQIKNALNQAKKSNVRPTVIIAHTVKGKGVDFMENKLSWHYKSPSASEYQSALNQMQA